jgi:glycine cleavage system H protein
LNVPTQLRYTDSHEWIDPDGSPHRVGLTDYAQTELSDVVYVELPQAGSAVTKGSPCAVVESCKAASDVYAPISGTIVEVNTELDSRPELVNQDPYGEGWLFTIESNASDEIQQLLDSAGYQEKLPSK